jgi:hypothetical protein
MDFVYGVHLYINRLFCNVNHWLISGNPTTPDVHASMFSSLNILWVILENSSNCDALLRDLCVL